MHIMSKMFVFFWRKVLIYKNWTWIVFTFCKLKTLIVIFISWAAHHIWKLFKASQEHMVWVQAIFWKLRVIATVSMVVSLFVVVFIIVLFAIVVFGIAHYRNMHIFAPHGSTSAEALISHQLWVKKVVLKTRDAICYFRVKNGWDYQNG